MLVSSAHVGAVNLQTHRTSLCPGDIGAVFICEANGTIISWWILDNEDGDDTLEFNKNDQEGKSVTRNGNWATLFRKFAVDQHYSFTSVLTIFDTERKELTIECSSDLPNDIHQVVQFYNEIPAPPPPPVVTITPADAALQVTWTTPTHPGQTISYTEITLSDGNVVQVNSQLSNTFSAPAVAGTVSVRTVDACGQKSEASVVEVDLSLVTTSTPDNACATPHSCTWLLILFVIVAVEP